MPHFTHGEVEIAYLDEGEGEPIVLVHGFASNKEVNWVYPGWVSTLARAGRRVIALDNRGHGASTKFYDPAAYHSSLMAEDVRALLDHLEISRADVMGYSLGSRITTILAVAHPQRVRAAILGGIGIHLVDGPGLSAQTIAAALEAPTRADVTDPRGHTFRAFAEQTRSDLACARRLHPRLAADDRARRTGRCHRAASVAAGSKDDIAGSTRSARGAGARRQGTRHSRTRSHARGRRSGVQDRRRGIPGTTPMTLAVSAENGVSQWPYYISARGRFSRGH